MRTLISGDSVRSPTLKNTTSKITPTAMLAQPRLVTDGDVKGGRYVSGVVDIYVGTGPAS